MKATILPNYSYYACHRQTACRFPGGTNRRYSRQKFLDTLLAAAITVAVVVILMFLLTL